MNAFQVFMPASAMFAKPVIGRHTVRWICKGKDVTPPIDHGTNRWACRMANERNAEMAKKLGIPAPYYHYDALRGDAILIEPTRWKGN